MKTGIGKVKPLDIPVSSIGDTLLTAPISRHYLVEVAWCGNVRGVALFKFISYHILHNKYI